MGDVIMSILAIALLTYCALEARAIWITRRQPVRPTAPTEGIWITPEPRVRRHYDRD